MSVPESVIGHCCYMSKCVWATDVGNIERAALDITVRADTKC